MHGGDNEPHKISERLLGVLDEPIIVNSLPVVVSASIGIALDSARHGSLATLMHEADVAMYEAKQRGGHCAVLFDARPPDEPGRGSTFEK